MHQDYETGNHAMFSPFNYVINSNLCKKSQNQQDGWHYKIKFYLYLRRSSRIRFYSLLEILKTSNYVTTRILILHGKTNEATV